MTTAAELLLDTARRGELHHSMILHGPSRDELRALALGLAKTLNCMNGTTGDDCAACDRIERRLHPDVHFIEVGGERKLISIEQIRDLVAEATMRPYEGRNKVFVIDQADALSVSGSNSLLKTLEEPTRDTTFILITRSPDLLLPTIRSRSQAIFVGGEAAHDEELAEFIREGLQRFARERDTAALLSIAASVAQREETGDAIALLGTILCDAAAGRLDLGNIATDRILAAADGTTAALRWLAVNADARLVVEQALAELVQ
ncbi:MAG: AAA family ATPase [Thermoanaerobaculia bacterium]